MIKLFNRKKKQVKVKVEVDNPILKTAIIELTKKSGCDVDGDIIKIYNNTYYVNILRDLVVCILDV